MSKGRGVIDIHTHILYGIDDGARTREMSLKLMEMDYDQGVRGIFLTNHSYGMRYRSREYYQRFEELEKEARILCPELDLYKGCEILCSRREMQDILLRIKDGTYPTMNETDYVLLEFDPYTCAGMLEMEYCLDYILNANLHPIIAHAERYERIYDHPVEDLSRLKNKGCLVQINLYSVAQDKGNRGNRKELANAFLENRLVDFVGTDTHRLDYKPAEAKIGAEAIRSKFGEAYADAVLYGNVERMHIASI